MPAEEWSELHWQALMLAISTKRCTPFLGSAACSPPLPLGGELAMICAEAFNYPFRDPYDLARVTQYGAVQQLSLEQVKAFVANALKNRGPRNAADSAEPHQVLAELDLPIYITTNYDDFMLDALRARGRKPVRKVCQWYRELSQRRNLEEEEWPEPDEEHPIVYHLHGVWDEESSMVLTDDDYLDFLIWAGSPDSIPPRIERSFTEQSLLFMGYSLRDVNFRVLFRRLSLYMRPKTGKNHAAVQIDPTTRVETEAERKMAEKEREYLNNLFETLRIRVYWGSCAEFAADLQWRWEKYRNDRPPGTNDQQPSVRGTAAVHA